MITPLISRKSDEFDLTLTWGSRARLPTSRHGREQGVAWRPLSNGVPGAGGDHARGGAHEADREVQGGVPPRPLGRVGPCAWGVLGFAQASGRFSAMF